MTAFNVTEAAEFLAVVFAGQLGLIQIGATDKWRGDFFPTTERGIEQAAEYAGYLDRAEPWGVYFRVTTLDRVPSGRGFARDTCAVPVLWADLDYGTEGHKPRQPTKYEPNPLPNPPTEDDVRGLIAEAGLPEPTILVHSGGGLYPLWRVDGWESLHQAERASLGVQQALQTASAAHDWAYGTGVADLARMLRLPGSVNRKTANHRPCRVIA